MLNKNFTPTKTLQLIYKKIKPSSHFLDLGFGQGRDALFMAKNKFNVTAVEKSEVLVKQIQEKIKKDNLNNIKVIQSNVLDFEIEKNKYNAINCNNVLQFLPKDKK
ncbi:methyltransferase domain-containing protein [Candidatus Parcubacteria bacterium]|nr:methyltransferase domain-containing protein [Patescibacteria group bacterium]MCG2686968.1 methyltransferase domain-containing protein [Candidatus Parcubacteria bacterium]